jgi:hypothetical protein
MDVVGTADSRKRDLAEVLPNLRECPGKALCAECFWWVDNGGQCLGCDDAYQKRCLKRVCDYNCYHCSGGKHAITPGCCGRVAVLRQSWHDRLKKILEYPVEYYYDPTPVDIKCRLIPILYPDIRKFKIPEQFPQIDTWAVPIHRVANRKGKFWSNDLKDYLGLPPDRKLILDTCAPDNYQEALWEKGPQMEYGIDYWFPGYFSIYDDDSKLYQFISAKRQQIHAAWTKSQFVWFRLSEDIPLEFLSPIRNAHSVLISTNQMYSRQNKEILLKEVKIADLWFPSETAFFIVGSHRWLNLPDKRRCFDINTSWLVRARKGRDMARKLQLDKNGKLLETGERLTNNLREVLKNVS